MKIEIKELKSLNRNTSTLDIRCHKVDDLFILAEFKNLTELQLKGFKGANLAFLEYLTVLKRLVLENTVPQNQLEDLSSLKSLEYLFLQTPIGWDGSGKRVEYFSLRPLSNLISLKELCILDVIVKESGFSPLFGLKELIVTNNTFSTRDFAELDFLRPDIECHYAAAYYARQIEYFICKKCGANKFEFSGKDLLRRIFCPNCNKKKVEELTERFEDIKAELAKVEINS